MRYLVLLLGVALLLGCTAKDEAKVAYTTYENELYSIDYPSDWTVEQDEDNIVKFVSKRSGLDDDLLEIFEIGEISDLLNTNKDFEDFEKRLMYEGDNLTKKREMFFKGRDALYLETEGVSPENKAHVLYTAIYFESNGTMFRLGYGIEKGQEEKYRPIMEHMLDSFELK